MQDLKLYEKKVIYDKEFPAQLLQNDISKRGCYFGYHWHEHIELHYVLHGEGIIQCNQEVYKMVTGNLAIVNSNELHQGCCTTYPLHALVLIFDIEAFSTEMADKRLIFQNLIQEDPVIKEIFLSLFQENRDKKIGYKIAMKGKIYELISYLMRNYVAEKLTTRENTKRNRDLNRLNTVLEYVEKNYMNPITNKELASLINLSEYRFCHLFKEVMEQSPSVYLSQIRLNKAYHLLKQGDLTVSEVSNIVGFSDYNNFGRQFRKLYGDAPSKIRNS